MSVSRRAFTIGLGTVGLGAVPLLQGKAPAANASTPESKAVAPPAPKFFDEHELATVAAMAEIILPATDTPGAREAHVAEYLDLILSDSPELMRTAFLEGLWWTDGYCRRATGTSFKDLPGQEQLRILSELDDSSDESVSTGRLFVQSMKAWTARIYYSTEIGEKELNKEGRVPASYVRPCESGSG
jgi:hypothetical protein